MRVHVNLSLMVLIASATSCAPWRYGHTHDMYFGQDTIVINAKIWTADPQSPTATALAICNGRFLYVGDEKTVRAKAEKNALVIDAGGQRVIPGLIDSHLHLIDGGLQLSRINLRDVPDRAAFIEAVRQRAAETSADQWIQGGRWSTESWPDPSQPTKEWIDAVTPNNPVLLSRMDGHGALANSVALAKAGIDRSGPADPPGGDIERDASTGEPTGVLKDTAIELVSKHIPKPSDAELDAGLQAAMKHANQHGITCVHTMSEFAHLAAFNRAPRDSRLTVRIRHYISEDDWTKFQKPLYRYTGNDWCRIVGFKAYADGSLGSRTAYMSRPYSDNPATKAEWRGLLRECIREAREHSVSDQFLTMEELESRQSVSDHGPSLDTMCWRIRAFGGFAPAVHAIGDQANHLVLDEYEFTYENVVSRRSQATTRPSFDITPRIEHAQHLLPTDIPRFAQLGVVASMQPLHKADDARYAEKAIGAERCKTSYAFRSLLDAGALVAFGSDWPVVSLDPFLGVRAAVTGLSLDNKVFVPEQNITVEEALICYTRNAARAAGDQDSLGMIREGYLADFVILDFDPFTADPKSFDGFRGDTYVAGKLVASTSRAAKSDPAQAPGVCCAH